jgi:hypothetical protein
MVDDDMGLVLGPLAKSFRCVSRQLRTLGASQVAELRARSLGAPLRALNGKVSLWLMNIAAWLVPLHPSRRPWDSRQRKAETWRRRVSEKTNSLSACMRD